MIELIMVKDIQGKDTIMTQAKILENIDMHRELQFVQHRKKGNCKQNMKKIMELNKPRGGELVYKIKCTFKN